MLSDSPLTSMFGRVAAGSFVLAMALTGVLLTELPGSSQPPSSVRDQVQVAEDLLREGEHQDLPMRLPRGAAGGGGDTEVLGAPVSFQQTTPATPTATPTATPSPSPSPSPSPTPGPTLSPTPAATVVPGSDDDLPETGAEVLVLGTVGTWVLFLGMLLLHVATRRTERLRSLDL